MTQTPRYKVHSSYIWLAGTQSALSMLLVYVVLFLSLGIGDSASSLFRNNSEIIVLVVVGAFVLFLIIAGLLFLLQYFLYKHLWFELGPSEFSLYSGIFSKKRVHIPYQRVQSVNQRATLIQRIFGVCTVHIDTAGGAQNKAVVVPYLRKTDAEWLRTQLFTQKQVIMQAHIVKTTGEAQAPLFPTGQPAAPGAFSSTSTYAPPFPGTPSSSYTAPYPGTPSYTAPCPDAPAYAQSFPVPGSSGNVLDAPAGAMNDIRGVFGGAGFDLGAVSYSHGLTNKELIFTGMSNNGSVAAVIITILTALFGVAIALLGSLWEGQIGQGVDFTYNGGTGFITFIVIISLVGFIAFVWLMSIVGTCITYGGYTARRRGSRIEVEYGILQHRFDGVDIDRVQSVIVKQSFIRRLIGYAEVSLGKIDALSDAQKQNQSAAAQAHRGIVVHPFVKLNRVPDILANLVPEYSDVPVERIKLPEVALRRAILRRCIVLGNGFWTAVIVALIHICLNLFVDGKEILMVINIIALAIYILCLILIVLNGVAAVMWYNYSGFAYNHSFMQVSNGGFSRESVSFPKKKIQFGFTRSNPFQRMSKVVTINARTAAGIGGTTVRLIDAHEEDAQVWLDWLLPQRSA